jgi:hypothetical protein
VVDSFIGGVRSVRGSHGESVKTALLCLLLDEKMSHHSDSSKAEKGTGEKLNDGSLKQATTPDGTADDKHHPETFFLLPSGILDDEDDNHKKHESSVTCAVSGAVRADVATPIMCNRPKAALTAGSGSGRVLARTPPGLCPVRAGTFSTSSGNNEGGAVLMENDDFLNTSKTRGATTRTNENNDAFDFGLVNPFTFATSGTEKDPHRVDYHTLLSQGAAGGSPWGFESSTAGRGIAPTLESALGGILG